MASIQNSDQTIKRNNIPYDVMQIHVQSDYLTKESQFSKHLSSQNIRQWKKFLNPGLIVLIFYSGGLAIFRPLRLEIAEQKFKFNKRTSILAEMSVFAYSYAWPQITAWLLFLHVSSHFFYQKSDEHTDTLRQTKRVNHDCWGEIFSQQNNQLQTHLKNFVEDFKNIWLNKNWSSKKKHN